MACCHNLLQHQTKHSGSNVKPATCGLGLVTSHDASFLYSCVEVPQLGPTTVQQHKGTKIQRMTNAAPQGLCNGMKCFGFVPRISRNCTSGPRQREIVKSTLLRNPLFRKVWEWDADQTTPRAKSSSKETPSLILPR